MIQFDPKTLASWKERDIRTISCIITDTGCAGHKIAIKEGYDGSLDYTLEQNGMHIHLRQEYLPSLENSMITWTGKKWILTSTAIHTRCGCGSSFSLKTGNPKIDKIAELKLKMKQKKEGVHT